MTVVQANGQVTLTVADQGSGIPVADHEHIFERFYRVDASRSSKIEGSGLGLAIVSQLVQLNQGTISVSDNAPHGTKFTVTLQTSD